MARFRLRGKHYLNVPGTEWEQKELDQATGKQARKIYPVPMFLDPAEPADCNYPGEIIVATEISKGNGRDIVFLGDPTPDMEPLDDEAEALVESLKHKWVHPIESLSGTYGESLMGMFQSEIAKLQSNTGAAPNDIITKMQRQIEELQKQVNEKPKAEAPKAERKV